MRWTISMVVAVAMAALFTFGGEAGNWFSAKEAHAVLGRPATPGSVAGVARRTTRRTVARTGAYYPNTVTALPANRGCVARTVNGSTAYACGGTNYRPYYDGPNLVYVPL